MINQTQTEKAFVFLYPISEYINNLLLSRSIQRMNASLRKKEEERYMRVVGEMIDKRYRQQGFAINYAVFSEREISDFIKLQKGDRVIDVGVSFQNFIANLSYQDTAYPDQENIINQLGNPEVLRIGGFHMWDCVERLAIAACNKSHAQSDILVDEDLTDLGVPRIIREGFRTDAYRPFHPEVGRNGFSEGLVEMYWKAREGKPWFVQREMKEEEKK